MEDLTKQQIVLVTLLVSFVTSIATGIVTVALMDQAPKGITNTINHVVERTIEKVVPGDTQETAAAAATVIVQEERSLADAAEAAQASLVRIKRVQGSVADAQFISLGTIITTNAIIADKTNITPDGTYLLQFSNGVEFLADKVQVINESDVAFISFTVPADMKARLKVKPAVFAAESSVRIGENVFMITSSTSSKVYKGIVQEILRADGTAIVPQAQQPIKSLLTDIVPAAPVGGSLLVDIDGKIIGVMTARSIAQGQGVFFPATEFSSRKAQAEAFAN